MKKVVIIGGSGFIGAALVKEFLDREWVVVVVDLREPADRRALFVPADTTEHIAPESVLKHPTAVINLAGANIFTRWNTENKELIYDSRIQTTRNLIALMRHEKMRPDTFVSASAVGYYGNGNDRTLTERSPNGKGFLATLARDWEQEAMQAAAHGIQTTIIRNAIVLGNGGILRVLLPWYRLGLGGPIGNGEQYFPWVHIEDVVQLYVAAACGDISASVVNAVAPEEVSNKVFSKELAAALHRPHIMRIPRLALRLRYGQLADEITYSQRVKSVAAPEFIYHYQHIDEAFTSIL